VNLEIRACNSERQIAIRSASYFFGVAIILPVIFPIAHFAYLKPTSFRQRPMAAARAAVLLRSFRKRDVLKWLHAFG
jgi:hypothetical protein